MLANLMNASRSMSRALVLLVALASCRTAPDAAVTPELVEQNNRAVGLMGQFDFTAAVDAFAAIQSAAPDWPEGRLNLAIALMNRQGEGDSTRAEALLRALIDTPAVARRARYALGLLLAHDGRSAEALPLLTAVANADPPDGFAAYFAGQLRLADAPAEALEWYRRAASLQPLLRSAHYGAFLALRRLNRDDEATPMLARFQALDGNPQAMVAEFKYTRMGPLSEAITVDAAADRPRAAPCCANLRPAATLVVESGMAWRKGGTRSFTVADLDDDHTLDVFIDGAIDGPDPNAVVIKRGQRYALDRTHPLARVRDVRSALW